MEVRDDHGSRRAEGQALQVQKVRQDKGRGRGKAAAMSVERLEGTWVYCPYKRREVSITECQKCPPEKKENCSALPGW